MCHNRRRSAPKPCRALLPCTPGPSLNPARAPWYFVSIQEMVSYSALGRGGCTDPDRPLSAASAYATAAAPPMGDGSAGSNLSSSPSLAQPAAASGQDRRKTSPDISPSRSSRFGHCASGFPPSSPGILPCRKQDRSSSVPRQIISGGAPHGRRRLQFLCQAKLRDASASAPSSGIPSFPASYAPPCDASSSAPSPAFSRAWHDAGQPVD